jgi:NHLM bacteriocin system ABC transporter ATP-binding protein
LLNLPAGFFRRFTAGDLANRALGINRIQRLLSSAAVSSCVAGIFSIFNLALLFYYGGNLAYPAIGIILLSLVFATVCLVLQLKYQRTLFDVIGSIQSLTLQFIKGVGKLRVGGAEIRALHKWAGKYARQKELDLKTRYVTNTVGVFSSSMPLVASLIIFGWLALSRDQALISMGAGQFLGFNAAFTTILTAIFTTMIFLFPMLQVVPLFERIRPLLQEIPELEAGKAEPADLTGAIEAAHLFFRYAPDAPMVLKDVSLHVNPGEFAAVVGPSGSGKSTFFRLLLGFETPQSGSIYFDGRDLAGLDIQAVRRQMGVVVQTGKLQPGSIFQNIVGATRLTLDDAWEAARMAALDKDIEAMPMGMHTFIGEDGAGLSGGQQQRLLIARAVVRKPRILLFDEATSALDNESQAVVSKSLKDLQSTRIVIAHRLSTIKSADRIFVLVAGEIVETGRYEELMALNGEFAELARRQIA